MRARLRRFVQLGESTVIPSSKGMQVGGVSRVITFATLMSLSGLGCGSGGRYIMIGGAAVPSTSGIVEVDELDEGSSLVTVHLEHLSPPRKAGEDREVYVVWFEGPNGDVVKAGELRYDASYRTGDFAETSPFHEFTVKITAERKDHGSTPSDLVVASESVIAD